MKIGTLFKKTASLIAAGLFSLNCIQPLMLWAEEKANTAQDEEIDYPDHIFDIYIYYVTDENEYEIVEYTFYDPQEYVTMNDLGISLPEYTSPASGVTQTGWKDSMGNPITEDTVFHTHDDYAAGIIQMIYADYDKAVSVGHISYINSEGIVIEDTAVGFFDEGATYGEANAYFQQYMPDDMTTDYTFSGWEPWPNNPDDDVVLRTTDYNSLTYDAQYEEGLMVEVTKYYIGETGMEDAIESSAIVPAGTTYEDIFNDFLSNMTDADIPVSYPGLRFSKWDYHGYQITPTYEVQNGSFLNLAAVYENSIIRHHVDPKYYYGTTLGILNDPENFYCEVVEPGEVVNVNKTFPEYESITWRNLPEGDTITVEANTAYDYYGFGELADMPVTPEPTPSVEPEVTPEPSTDPETTPEPEKPEEQAKTLEEVSDEAVNVINNAQDGVAVNVDMHGYTTVTAEMLSAAKDKNINVVLNGMGPYYWTINGKDITTDQYKDVNLYVEPHTTGIPADVLKNVAGENETMQIELPLFSGDFGFKAILTISVGSDKAGQYGNLYYYNAQGGLDFVDAGKIDNNGMLNLTFSHASNYVIVFADHDMSVAQSSPGPETGVWNSPAPYVATILVCAIGALLIRKRQVSTK